MHFGSKKAPLLSFNTVIELLKKNKHWLLVWDVKIIE